MRAADATIVGAQALSTPTFLVNGKYRLNAETAGGYDQMIDAHQVPRSPRKRPRSPSNEGQVMSASVCKDLKAVESVKTAERRECSECVKMGAWWVHLRVCQECGATLCCGSSPNKHASKHALERASGDLVGRAGRTLAVLLPARFLRRVLSEALSVFGGCDTGDA